jgi:hypothetical protein
MAFTLLSQEVYCFTQVQERASASSSQTIIFFTPST